MDEIVRLVKLPYTVPGLVTEDEDGTPCVYLNNRLTSAQHVKTYQHEVKHIKDDDLHNDKPIETVENLLSEVAYIHMVPTRYMPPKPEPTIAEQRQARLNATYDRGKKLYGLLPDNPLWSYIFNAWYWNMYPDRFEEILNSHPLYTRNELIIMTRRIFNVRGKPWIILD